MPESAAVSPTSAAKSLSGPLTVGILTYNRPEALLECIRHLEEQTRKPDALVIWNNGTAGTVKEAISSFTVSFPVSVIDSPANLGPTGGYHELVNTILDNPEVTHFYLIDDDCFMAPDNLRLIEESLLADSSGRIAAIRGLHPKEVQERGNQHTPFTTNSAGWCGCLYRAEAVRAVGGPIRDLFFSYGEWEWSTRLRWHGWLLKGHPQARFEFLTDEDERGRALRGASMRNSHHRISYFKMRNATYMGLYLPHMRVPCSWFRRAEIFIGQLWLSPDRARTFRALSLAMKHGRMKKLGWVDVEALTARAVTAN